MTEIKRIVAASDLSAVALCAVQRAVQLAIDHGATLSLLHVVEDTALRKIQEWLRASGRAEGDAVSEAQQKLRIAAEDVTLDRLRPIVRVEVGDVVDRLRAAAADADLIVLGARDPGHLLPFRMFGKTAERLIAESRTPTLIVRQACRGPYQKVLVPTDFSGPALEALRWALRMAPANNIVVFNACREPFESMMHYASVREELVDEYRRKATNDARALMENLRQEFAAEGHHFDTRVEYGYPASLILTQARKLSADLIVMGKHGRSKLDEFFLGSVTRDVLASSEGDVVVVPAK
jgi:nucleotide-binding universal stress UspA family protein